MMPMERFRTWLSSGTSPVVHRRCVGACFLLSRFGVFCVSIYMVKVCANVLQFSQG